MKELTNVPGLNPDDKVVIKKYSYIEKSKWLDKCVILDTKDVSNSVLKILESRIYTLLYGIHSAPFWEVGKDKIPIIETLANDTGEFLFNEITQYNEIKDLDQLKKK